MKLLLDELGRPVCVKLDEGESLPVLEFDLIMDQTPQGPVLRLVVPLTTGQVRELFEVEGT